MSVPSNREQIKKKQELQTQFQLSLSQVNSKILSWLPEEKPAEPLTQARQITKSMFESLPIIKQGSGLNLSSPNPSSKNDSIGDFVNGSGAPVFQNANSNNNRGEDSAMLKALKNKLRNDDREKAKKGISKSQPLQKRQQQRGLGNVRGVLGKGKTGRGGANSSNMNITKGNSNSADSDSNSDDDEMVLRKIKSGAKAKSVNSKRPF